VNTTDKLLKIATLEGIINTAETGCAAAYFVDLTFIIVTLYVRPCLS